MSGTATAGAWKSNVSPSLRIFFLYLGLFNKGPDHRHCFEPVYYWDFALT